MKVMILEIVSKVVICITCILYIYTHTEAAFEGDKWGDRPRPCS